MQKKLLRQEMLRQRNELNKLYKKQYDVAIAEKLLDLIIAEKWNIIHVYISMDNELSTLYLIEQLLSNSKTVICPKTLPNRQLEHHILQNIEDVEMGIKGTIHPKNSLIYDGNYDVIVVPGLGFDENNYRLGYGGGYYDVFLNQHPNAFKVALAYPFQLIAKMPIEQHDIPIDKVLVI